MREAIDLADPSYTPVKLLNETAFLLGCEDYSALALMLEVDIGFISRVRRRKVPISAHLLVQILDRTGWTIRHARELMGLPFDGPLPPTEAIGFPVPRPKPPKRPAPERKLDPDKVRAIRIDQRARMVIAKEYGVTTQLIWYVQKHKAWRHVE